MKTTGTEVSPTELRIRDRWVKAASLHSEYSYLVATEKFNTSVYACGPSAVETWISGYCSGSQFPGMGTILMGPPGHGKTMLGNYLLEKTLKNAPADMFPRSPRRPGFFIPMAELMELEKSLMSPDQYDQEELWSRRQLVDGIYGRAHTEWNVSILLLDDTGPRTEGRSEWVHRQFDNLLRGRHGRGLPTIITTNTLGEDWQKLYSPEMASFIQSALPPKLVKSISGDLRSPAPSRGVSRVRGATC